MRLADETSLFQKQLNVTAEKRPVLRDEELNGADSSSAVGPDLILG